MSKKYWLSLFTGTTWEEFLKHDAKTMGFKETKKNSVSKISKGDYLICYVSGVSRITGILEVTSEHYFDESKIWEMATFPERVDVKLIHKLEPKTSIPILDLKDELSLFKNLKNPKLWAGFFLSAPRQFDDKDGEIIFKAVKNAIKKPVEKDFDEKRYNR